MGAWCSLLVVEEQAAAKYRSELVRTVLEFTQSTRLPLGPGVEDAFVTFFDRTIGTALVSGISWDGREAPLHQYRRIAQGAERIARTKGEDCISVDTFNQAAYERVEFVRRKEREQVA